MRKRHGKQLVPAMVLRIFDASEFMLEIGIPALRILALSWFLSIPGLVLSAGLQGLSMGMSSMVITMTRQAVLPLVFTMILRMFGNLDVLWTGFLAAELAGIPLAVFLWKKRLAGESDSNRTYVPITCRGISKQQENA